MYFQFPSFRVSEFTDIREFNNRAAHWLAIREAENSYLFVELAALLANPSNTSARAFIVEEQEVIVCAGVLFGSGTLLLTWAPPEAIPVIADQLHAKGWNISSIYAPGHVSWTLAKAWAERTHQHYQLDRAERIYQLARTSYELPPDGTLALATAADRSYLEPWMKAFIEEARFETNRRSPAEILNTLIDMRALFVWKTDRPASMAAVVAPTPRGASINFVYTPPELRGRGHAKAVVAAVANTILAADRKYCFIFADPDDHQMHKLYQQVGARTLCEYLRCTLHANAPTPRISSPHVTLAQS